MAYFVYNLLKKNETIHHNKETLYELWLDLIQLLFFIIIIFNSPWWSFKPVI